MPITKIFRSLCCTQTAQSAEEANTTFQRVASLVEEVVEEPVTFSEEKEETKHLPKHASAKISAITTAIPHSLFAQEIARTSRIVGGTREFASLKNEETKDEMLECLMNLIQEANEFAESIKGASPEIMIKQINAFTRAIKEANSGKADSSEIATQRKKIEDKQETIV